MNNKKLISMDKKYTTKDGSQVRIYSVEEGEVHGAFRVLNSSWILCKWTLDGLFLDEPLASELTLVEVKKKVSYVMWLNVYPGDEIDSPSIHTLYGTESRAKSNAGIRCLKTIAVPIEYEI